MFIIMRHMSGLMTFPHGLMLLLPPLSAAVAAAPASLLLLLLLPLVAAPPPPQQAPKHEMRNHSPENLNTNTVI